MLSIKYFAMREVGCYENNGVIKSDGYLMDVKEFRFVDI